MLGNSASEIDLPDMMHKLEGLGFFFKADGGIRDVAVTGVQTCALPIFFIRPSSNPPEGFASDPVTIGQAPVRSGPPTPCSPRVGAVAYPLSSGRADGSAAAFRSGRRSEERRVGKACRSGTPPKHVR